MERARPRRSRASGPGRAGRDRSPAVRPRPVQRGQAPCGELNEKIRGSSSGRPTPCSGQAKFSRERGRLAVEHVDHDEPVGELSGGLHRLGEPRAQVRLEHEAVDDDLDRVLELLVELDRILEQLHFAVDLHAREAFGPQLLEQILELALPVAHDRRIDGELRALGELEDLVDDRLLALPGDRPAADRAVRLADPGVEEAQVVVDLRDGADGGARVAARRLLVDRDRGAEPVDRVHVRLLHHLEELAGVGGEALHVPALALRVDRVEGQAGLAGAGQPGDADQLQARQADGDVLEVVLPRAVNDELFLAHNQASLAPLVDANKCSLCPSS